MANPLFLESLYHNDGIAAIQKDEEQKRFEEELLKIRSEFLAKIPVRDVYDPTRKYREATENKV